jgi:predicted nuclease of predicted toxin-antitoxin system
MTIRILLDHNLEGHAKFLLAGLRETGWDRYLSIDFVYMRHLNLPDDASDAIIWRVAQAHHLLLLTDNRNREDEDSLEAVIEREGTPESLPVLTVASIASLPIPEYRQRSVHKLAEIVTYIENYLGIGRIYLP